MNTKAIERIKGYCCEVNEEQWEELVKVADEVGVDVSEAARHYGTERGQWGYAQTDKFNGKDVLNTYEKCGTLIPFPEFLAKLRGEEKWEPKAGEMVEVKDGPKSPWYSVEFVGKIDGWNVCRVDHNEYTDFIDEHIRPIRPTITRAEAEQQLGKRIIG